MMTKNLQNMISYIRAAGAFINPLFKIETGACRHQLPGGLLLKSHI